MADMNGTNDTPYIDNPWGGVSNGLITMPPGVQFSVDQEGHVTPTAFSPSVAVGDLNDDGLPDLVIADAKGYFWYFQNSGTPTVPKFTEGEVMPIWLGDPVVGLGDQQQITAVFDANDNTVPRIQLVDYTGEHKLSIVAGNYQGKLYYIHNAGTAKEPSFFTSPDLDGITVDTYSEHHLWCNFLAPFLYDFTGNGQLDLIMGEGTYASNSIYRLTNRGGSGGSPTFNEKFTTKIIPGYGREHLTPQVIDWNHDGKPDIICGEREGFIDFFANTSTDPDPNQMTFDTHKPPDVPQHIKFGDMEKLGSYTTVALADLTGNHLPNLVISNTDEHVLYAQNKGKLGAPQFDAPVPLTGVNPLPKVYAPPAGWSIHKAFSMPYVLLVSTKAKDDPSFKPPDDAPNIRSALKIYTVPHTHKAFNREVYPEDDTKLLYYDPQFQIQAGVHYDVSFYAKASGNVDNPRYAFAGNEDLLSQGGKDGRYVYLPFQMETGSDWVKNKIDLYLPKADRDRDDTAPLQFIVMVNGNGGALSLTGFQMTKHN